MEKTKLMAARTRLPKIGDVMRMESFTEDNTVAYYVVSTSRGPLVEVWRGPRADDRVDNLRDYQLLVPGTFVGINPPVRTGDWKIVGHVPVPASYRPDKFLVHSGSPGIDKEPTWYLFDIYDESRILLGPTVPESMRDLHLTVGVSGLGLEDEIRGIQKRWDYYSRMSKFFPFGLPSGE